MNSKIQNYLPYFIITACSVVILQFIFGAAFWQPNAYAFMNGGDGNVIYYNMLYHTLYGSGVYLEGMNYPDPECIFMTDAQGSISFVLSKLRSLFPGIGSYVLGITHVVIMISIWLQFLLLYQIIRKLKGPIWVAIVFAIGIGSLSPQLVRISYGHIGLAYPFIIPLAILWILHLRKDTIWTWTTGLFAITVLFFGFNNPYLLVVVSILLVTYGGIGALQKRTIQPYYIAILFGFGFLLLLYIVTSGLDPYEDRIKNQWGSFYFASTIEGLLWGRYSLLNSILESIGISYEGRSESRASISLVSLLILIPGVVYYLFQHYRQKKIPWSHPMVVLTLASGASFIYASSLFKSKWWLWLTEDLGFITMVKAAGRLSWINYYVLSILSVFLIVKFLHSKGNNVFRRILVLILGLFCCGEGYFYIKDHVKPNLLPNHFSTESLDTYISPKKEAIDFSGYQGILSIPIMQSWNDNLMNSSDWATELQVFSMSAATGIPIVGAKLSRSPIERSLNNLQLTAHPLIRKEMQGNVESDRPLLLLKTCNIQIETSGEEWLLQQARLIYQDKNVDIFEIWPEDFNHQVYVQQQLDLCSEHKNWQYYQGFEDSEVQGKIGNGHLIGKDWQEVQRIIVPDSIHGLHELSIWSLVNIRKYGMPTFEVWVFDANGNRITYKYIDGRNFIDNQDGWLKMHQVLDLQPNQEVILKARGRYSMQVDELLLRPVHGAPTCIYAGERLISIDNIKISNL